MSGRSEFGGYFLFLHLKNISVSCKTGNLSATSLINPYPAKIILVLKMFFITSVAEIQVHKGLDFNMEANTMNLDLTTPLEFVLFDSLRPINNLPVKQGRDFLGWTSTKLG